MKKNLKIDRMLLVGFTLLVLMAGCKSDSEPIVPTEPSIPEALADPTQWPKVEAYSGSPLLMPDPQRTVYISLSNQDVDFYQEYNDRSLFFWVITKEHYNKEDFSVRVPIKTTYQTIIHEFDDTFRHVDAYAEEHGNANGAQMIYHYLCMQNIDLQELAQMQRNADCAGAALRDGGLSTEEINALVDRDIEPYETKWQEYREAYLAQGTAPLTEYHAYVITISFDRLCDETAEYLDLQLGEETHRVFFGQWRFHSQGPEELHYTHKGISPGYIQVLNHTITDNPHLGGYIKLWNAMRFATSEDITLTGLRWQGGHQLELIGAQIQLGAEDSAIDFLWDGKQPLLLEKGSSVNLSAYLYGEALKEYEVCFSGFLYLDYTLVDSGKEDTFAMPCFIRRENEAWDTYCLAFLGVDVGEYYHYFQNRLLRTAWITEIPESWRKEK